MTRRLACLALVLAGCHAPAARTPVASPRAASCSAARPRDGFAPLARAGGVQFVASAADDPLATEMYAYFAKFYKGLELRRPADADRSKNLIVFGRADTNPLVAALAGPIAFQRGRFRFGGHVWDDASDGIAVLLPSPFAADRFVVAYVGNSPAGLELTQSVPTGDHQFTVVSLPLGVAQQGDFCREPGGWRYFAPFAVDVRREWDAYRATLARRTTAHHVVYFEPGSEAARDIDGIAAELEADYAGIVRFLGVAELERPIVTYLWSDRAKKKHFTGDGGNGRAFRGVVHAMYAPGAHAVGPHEYVHVVAGRRLGQATSALFGEGLAVAAGGTWHGRPLGVVARELARAGTLPSLDKLLCCFRDLDEEVSYPTAGHFVGFVIARFGIAALERVYATSDAATALREVLGVDVAALESAWRATLRE